MAERDDQEKFGEQAWRQLVERAIGTRVETLHSRSDEGQVLEPLYQRAVGDAPQPWRSETAWSIAQRVDHPDAETANQLALLDLDGGANALVLVGQDSPWSRGFGLDLAGGDLDLVCERVELDLLQLRLDAGPDTVAALSTFAELVERRRLTSARLDVDIGADPIGCGARLGRDLGDDTAQILGMRAKAGLSGTVFLADGRPWHEAGAGEAQELAAMLATTVAYLRRLEAQGSALEHGNGLIAVLLAMEADILLGLAKVRATRRLWARVQTACGLAPVPLRLHAETSWRMMTRYDPWTNAMRATAATFAAGLGGADLITVLPFTLPLGLPDEAARRLARNTQIVLLEEAHLAKVADPAAGSGAFESMTDGLCREAWRLFQAIESEGGLPRAIPLLKREIAETARARAGVVETLGRSIIGTSRFASLDVPPIEVLDVKPYPPLGSDLDALPAWRDAERFEVLRDRAEALARAGQRPKVFLATLGPPAAFGPRATYAANFFAAAGLTAETSLEERDLDTLTAAFRGSGAKVACLCGTDAAYSEHDAATGQALRHAGATILLLVIDDRDSLFPDIDAAIHHGCDGLAILETVLAAAGPSPADQST